MIIKAKVTRTQEFLIDSLSDREIHDDYGSGLLDHRELCRQIACGEIDPMIDAFPLLNTEVEIIEVNE